MVKLFMPHDGKVVGAQSTTDESAPVVWHASAHMPANLDTLCGVSLGDSDYRQVPPSGLKPKVTCEDCLKVWRQAMRFKIGDFS